MCWGIGRLMFEHAEPRHKRRMPAKSGPAAGGCGRSRGRGPYRNRSAVRHAHMTAAGWTAPEPDDRGSSSRYGGRGGGLQRRAKA
jgi:hypothetical protein